MTKLMDYLNIVDADTNMQLAHQKDPEGAMKAYGLNDEEVAAVMSGDKTQVAKTAGVDETSIRAIQSTHLDHG